MELNKIFAKYFKPASENENKVEAELCARCGGLCCQTMGCHIAPSDLNEISIESIMSLIDESGCVSIDWWDGNPLTNRHDGSKGFYLRIKNDKGNVIDPSYGGVCAILTNAGCPLAFQYRPKGGRELIPATRKCIVGYSKQQCAIDWMEYHDILEALYCHYKTLGQVSHCFMDYEFLQDLLEGDEDE